MSVKRRASAKKKKPKIKLATGLSKKELEAIPEMVLLKEKEIPVWTTEKITPSEAIGKITKIRIEEAKKSIEKQLAELTPKELLKMQKIREKAERAEKAIPSKAEIEEIEEWEIIPKKQWKQETAEEIREKQWKATKEYYKLEKSRINASKKKIEEEPNVDWHDKKKIKFVNVRKPLWKIIFWPPNWRKKNRYELRTKKK